MQRTLRHYQHDELIKVGERVTALSKWHCHQRIVQFVLDTFVDEEARYRLQRLVDGEPIETEEEREVSLFSSTLPFTSIGEEK